jgi:uncharacterized membrane protein YraQ (UPF0718 family)
MWSVQTGHSVKIIIAFYTVFAFQFLTGLIRVLCRLLVSTLGGLAPWIHVCHANYSHVL